MKEQNVKKTGESDDVRSGEVIEVRSDGKGHAFIEVRHGAAPKPSKKGEPTCCGLETKTSRICVPAADAGRYTVGGRVSIHIEPLAERVAATKGRLAFAMKQADDEKDEN